MPLPDGTTATRYNNGKPRLSLIDPYFTEELGGVLTMGAIKYDDYNWQKSLNTDDHDNFRNGCVDSLERHVAKMKKGELVDDESGLTHMAHVAANAMFIDYYDRNKNK